MTTKIASIYFAPVSADRLGYGGRYRIPAVARGAEPFLLAVEDKIEHSDGPFSTSPIQGQRQKLETMIYGEQIARDILASWIEYGEGMTAECHPGLWIVRERLPLINEDGTLQLDASRRPLTREATPEERRAMWEEDLAANKHADAKYAQLLIKKKDSADLLEEGDPRKFGVWTNAVLAAKHYGIERSPEWMGEMASADMKQCQYCQKLVRPTVVKCPHCHEVIDFKRYAELEAQRNAALATATKGAPVHAPVKQSAQPAA